MISTKIVLWEVSKFITDQDVASLESTSKGIHNQLESYASSEDWYHCRIYSVFLRFKLSVVNYIKNNKKAPDAIEKKLDRTFHQKHSGKNYFQVKKVVLEKLLYTSFRWFTTTAYPSSRNLNHFWKKFNTSIGEFNISEASKAFFNIPRSEEEYDRWIDPDDEFRLPFVNFKWERAQRYVSKISESLIKSNPSHYGPAIQFFREVNLESYSYTFSALFQICVALITVKKFDLARVFMDQYESHLTLYSKTSSSTFYNIKKYLEFAIAMRDNDFKKAYNAYNELDPYELHETGTYAYKPNLFKQLYISALSERDYAVGSIIYKERHRKPNFQGVFDEVLEGLSEKRKYIEAITHLDLIGTEFALKVKRKFVVYTAKDQDALYAQISNELKSNLNFVMPRDLFLAFDGEERYDLIESLSHYFRIVEGEIFPKVDERPRIVKLLKAQILKNEHT